MVDLLQVEVNVEKSGRGVFGKERASEL